MTYFLKNLLDITPEPHKKAFMSTIYSGGEPSVEQKWSKFWKKKFRNIFTQKRWRNYHNPKYTPLVINAKRNSNVPRTQMWSLLTTWLLR